MQAQAAAGAAEERLGGLGVDGLTAGGTDGGEAVGGGVEDEGIGEGEEERAALGRQEGSVYERGRRGLLKAERRRVSANEHIEDELREEEPGHHAALRTALQSRHLLRPVEQRHDMLDVVRGKLSLLGADAQHGKERAEEEVGPVRPAQHVAVRHLTEHGVQACVHRLDLWMSAG